MKKLMIAAAAAAMTAGAFAAACVDVEETSCMAWDLSLKLKSLGPKKTSCKDTCGEKSEVYYLDSANRKLKGYIWTCAPDCEGSDLKVVLWDASNKIAVIPLNADGTNQDGAIAPSDKLGEEVFAYGKKIDKVAAAFDLVGTDADAEDSINITVAGVNGKIKKDATDACYIKSLSGYAAGGIKVVYPNGTAGRQIVNITEGGLCGEPEIEVIECEEGEDAEVVYATLCDACCLNTWCDAEEVLDAGQLVPAVGTWSMKYNKKVSKGNRAMATFVPAYAF